MPGTGGAAVSETPDDVLYTESHEWVRIEDGIATVGITDHAQNALNDIVYVELPGVGDEFETSDEFGVVESVKSVSDLYMPVAGEIVETNGALEDAPETINKDPYGGGWLVKIRMQDRTEAQNLMSAGEYQDFTAG